MVSRGEAETEALQNRIESQLHRLVTQLQDLEENRDILEDDEHAYLKEVTIEQLKEFQRQLELSKSGDITLIDHINQVQIAIQQAVSESFKTPEVIRLFVSKQPLQLKARLEDIHRDWDLGRISETEYNAKRFELLLALSKLGQAMTDEEQEFIIAYSSAGNRVAASQDKDVNAEALMTGAKLDL